MNLRDFRIGWRLLVQEPFYSLVVVLGLAIGFATCFLLLGFVRYSLGYDAEVPDAGRIFLVKHKINTREKPTWNESTPLPFLAVAQRSGMVEAATAMVPLQLSLKVGGQVQSVEVAAVHPAFQDVFSVRASRGDLQAVLSRPDQVALSVSAAARLFGSGDALGGSVDIAGKPYRVGAILADRPSNSTVNYAALVGIDSRAWNDDERKELFQAWGNINGAKIYLKLKPGAAPESLEQLLQDASDNSPFRRQLAVEEQQKLGQRKLMELRLGALPDMYFDSDTANTPFSGPHGNLRGLIGLACVGLLILLLAATNYVNLATVRTLRRQREIAVRKVLGAAIGRLLGQFLAESLLVALIATALGLLLAGAVAPLFAELVDRKLDHMFTPAALLACLGLGALVGLAAGAYPAWVALRVRPQQTLSGRSSSETSAGLWLRRWLTVLQFGTAMALTAVTLAIAWQTQFASQANPGFDPASLLVVEMPADLQSEAGRGLRAALAHLPDVVGVAATTDPVGRNTVGGYIRISLSNGRWARVLVRTTSANFFDIYRLRPLAGRLFTPARDQDDDGFKSLVINAGTAKALGFATPQDAIGQIVTTGSGENAISGPIVGVAPDVRYESLRDTPQSMLYFTGLETPTLTVRTSGDLNALETAVSGLQRQYFPNDVVTVRRQSGYFALNYADDVRMAKLLGMASAIAIAIAGFGIYVLSAYSVQRLAKQIVLRKLFGADRGAIARLVGREFLYMVAAGAVIGLPLAAFSIEAYLAPFVERAPIGVWTLMAAVLVIVAVTLASTLRYTMVAMGMSPARILRD